MNQVAWAHTCSTQVRWANKTDRVGFSKGCSMSNKKAVLLSWYK